MKKVNQPKAINQVLYTIEAEGKILMLEHIVKTNKQ